jgi:hypothetical protein
MELYFHSFAAKKVQLTLQVSITFCKYAALTASLHQLCQPHCRPLPAPAREKGEWPSHWQELLGPSATDMLPKDCGYPLAPHSLPPTEPGHKHESMHVLLVGCQSGARIFAMLAPSGFPRRPSTARQIHPTHLFAVLLPAFRLSNIENAKYLTSLHSISRAAVHFTIEVGCCVHTRRR